MARLLLLIAIAAIVTLNAGCSTLADARAARGTGTAKMYDVPRDVVWEAIPRVLKEVGLDHVGDNRQESYVLAQRGVNLLSVGEQVAIYVEGYGARRTRVEVISKKALATNLFATDWEGPVLDALTQRLAAFSSGQLKSVGFATPRVEDVQAVPFLKESGKSGYEKFLATFRRPRAFAIGEKGHWGWRSGPAAETEALKGCESHGGKCYLYAVDNEVVWTALPAGGREKR